MAMPKTSPSAEICQGSGAPGTNTAPGKFRCLVAFFLPFTAKRILVTGTFHRIEQDTDEFVPVEQMWKSGSIAQLIEHFCSM